jgi:predicted deacetylase
MNASTRTLVVSLHDVHPASRALCAPILGELAGLGVERCALLVVPDFHHAGSILQDAAFCEWIGELSRRGHEIVAHGYHHLRARRTEETLAAKVVTRVYTADEGEFFDLTHDAARTLLMRARRTFAEAGLAPGGFIAPAWLLSAEAEDALRALDWEYTTRLRHVLDLHTGETIASPSLVWSVRSAWRRRTSLVWNAFLHRLLAPNPLLRISVHPVDVQHPAIWRQVRDMVALALATRRPTTYLQWILQRRTVAARSVAPEDNFRPTSTTSVS